MGGPWHDGSATFEQIHKDKGGLMVLAGMWKNGATLQKIGDYFGLTRERVRQIVEKFGYYKNPVKAKSIVKNTIQHSPKLSLKYGNYKEGSRGAKGKMGEILFQELFPDFKFNGHGAHCDFSNGIINIEIKKPCTKWFYVNKKNGRVYGGQYKINLTKYEKEHSDFVYIITPLHTYLIPAEILINGGTVLTPKFDRYIINPDSINYETPLLKLEAQV